MTLSKAGLNSFGALSRRALSHPNWPDDTKIKERSLATLFSKLDRNLDLDWLIDRPEVQSLLAELLNCQTSDLRIALGPAARSLPEHLFRLYSAPRARDFDLVKEELPPGLPAGLQDVSAWHLAHWQTEEDTSTRLFSAWMRQRGRARVHRTACSNLKSLDAELDQAPEYLRGPLILHLPRHFHFTGNLTASLRASQRPVLLITRATLHPEWIPVRTNEPQEYLPELWDWLVSRLPSLEGLRSDSHLAWLKRESQQSFTPKSWASLLGICSMASEYSNAQLRRMNLFDLTQRYVRDRVSNTAANTSWGPAIANQAWSRLEESAIRNLQAPRRAHAPLSLEHWGNLLQFESEQDRSAERDLLEETLTAALGHRPSETELKRAQQRTDPGGYQMARALEHGEVLVSITPQSSNSSENYAEERVHYDVFPEVL
ncbi:MAG: hypothetical protein MK135_04150, partial [Polyangiaceae bacterium]|nr:hypothetical protein [Polyangiaceae bacterium]